MGKKEKDSKKSEKVKKGSEAKTEKAKKADKKGGKKAKEVNTEFTQKKYSGSIALSKLKHVLMKKKGKKRDVKGIFIPIDQNCLVKGEEGAIYLNVSIITKSPQDQYGQNGFIAQNGNKKWSEASEKDKAKFKELPILGNIKDFEDSKGASDTSGKVDDKEYDENDDLPF